MVFPLVPTSPPGQWQQLRGSGGRQQTSAPVVGERVLVRRVANAPPGVLCYSLQKPLKPWCTSPFGHVQLSVPLTCLCACQLPSHAGCMSFPRPQASCALSGPCDARGQKVLKSREERAGGHGEAAARNGSPTYCLPQCHYYGNPGTCACLSQ